MRQTLHILTLLTTLVIIASCNQQTDTTEKTIDPEYGGLTAQFADFYNSAGPKKQVFKINPAKDTIIVGAKGTALFISANSLVDNNGQPIKGETTIELKEYLDFSDYVLGNLQTVSDDKLLVTQGMIYLQAENSNYTAVSIDPDAPVRIEIPTDQKPNPAAKIFKGARNAQGDINWTAPTKTDKKLIPVPIRSLNPTQPTECPMDLGFTNNDSIWNSEHNGYKYIFGDISDYENTLVATREFKNRFYHSFGCCCWKEVVQVYTKNLDKNMWEIDLLMVDWYKEELKRRMAYHDSTRQHTKHLPSWQHLRDIDKNFYEHVIEFFTERSKEKLTIVDNKRLLDTATIGNFNKAFYAYEALEFGWVNVDYFYEDPNAEPIQLFVQSGQVRPTVLNLAFPSLNIVLSATDMGDGKYRFTKNEDGYNKLPKGETALILAITFQDDKAYFTKQEITIGQSVTEQIELAETPLDKLEKEIKEITAPNKG
jgi:hypothetical protein